LKWEGISDKMSPAKASLILQMKKNPEVVLLSWD
jgi:hypothetical protein